MTETVFHEIASTPHSRGYTRLKEPVVPAVDLPEGHEPAKLVRNSGQIGGPTVDISARPRRDGVMVYQRSIKQ